MTATTTVSAPLTAAKRQAIEFVLRDRYGSTTDPGAYAFPELAARDRAALEQVLSVRSREALIVLRCFTCLPEARREELADEVDSHWLQLAGRERKPGSECAVTKGALSRHSLQQMWVHGKIVKVASALGIDNLTLPEVHTVHFHLLRHAELNDGTTLTTADWFTPVHKERVGRARVKAEREAYAAREPQGALFGLMLVVQTAITVVLPFFVASSVVKALTSQPAPIERSY